MVEIENHHPTGAIRVNTRNALGQMVPMCDEHGEPVNLIHDMRSARGRAHATEIVNRVIRAGHFWRGFDGEAR